MFNKKIIKDKKAQASLEVILLVIGAILIVTLIGFYLKKKSVELTNQGTDDLNSLVNKI